MAIGILCVALDVTNERHSQQQVLDPNAELSTTNAELSERNRCLRSNPLNFCTKLYNRGQ